MDVPPDRKAPTMTEHSDLVAANRELWDAWADLHVGSEFYDVEGFVAEPDAHPLDPLVLGVVGDVAGKRLLHLQCHFGLDTLRLARMGAEVTGVDFSANAIAHARDLAERVGIDARFVESDVRTLPVEVKPDFFDVVFTSHGAISWLPDLRPWAESVATRLAPGGTVHVVDMHPTLWIFDDEGAESGLRVRYGYFDRSPLPWQETGSYAAPDADFEGVSYSWQHTFEEIVGVLVEAGLSIRSLKEYERIAWQHMPWMERDADGMWRLPEGTGDIPLMFSISATKP